MKILFLTHHEHPHMGGVEKHINEISKILERKGNSIEIISEEDIKYPHKKIVGLFYIWKWFWKNKKLIKESDVVHCHDVFIWYLPFRFLFLFKKVFTTFHGWEGIYPVPFKNIFQKRLANSLSTKTVAIGRYIEKYYGIKTDKILYGAIDPIKRTGGKIKNYLVFLGRLEKDTGIIEFLEWLKENNKYQVDFIGDGSFHEECAKYGRVLGFVDPVPFLERASVCVPGGYLSYIEAKSLDCKVIIFPNNKLKEDYWSEIEKVKKFPRWDTLADEYIRLYNSSK